MTTPNDPMLSPPGGPEIEEKDEKDKKFSESEAGGAAEATGGEPVRMYVPLHLRSEGEGVDDDAKTSWNEIRELISGCDVKTDRDLEGLLNKTSAIVHPDITAYYQLRIQELPLKGLINAIHFNEKHMKKFDFYGSILPKIKAWALDPLDLKSIPLLVAHTNNKVHLTHKQIRHMLSLAFFLALPDSHTDLGTLSFHVIYSSKFVGCERVKCLLNYFYHECIGTYPQDEMVTFERRVLPESKHRVEWARCKKTLQPDTTFSYKHRIEDMEDNAAAIVDFANKRLQIFQMINSCTQEEVMFSCRPALKIGMLICEMMRDDEVILIHGARPYSEYTGYMRTFKYAFDSRHLHEYNKNKKKKRIITKCPTVIAIDAIVVKHKYDQYQLPLFVRDLNKAWLGFGGTGELGDEKDQSRNKPISTGMWGCGIFDGDPTLKMLQQAMASSVLERPLNYSTFGNQKLEMRFSKFYAALVTKKVSVGALFDAIVRYVPYLQKQNNDKRTKKRYVGLEAYLVDKFNLQL